VLPAYTFGDLRVARPGACMGTQRRTVPLRGQCAASRSLLLARRFTAFLVLSPTHTRRPRNRHYVVVRM
jgi:hypothetical protein